MLNRIIKKFKKRKKRKTEDLSPILRSEHAFSTDIGDGKGGDVVFMDPRAQTSLKAQQPQSANGVPEKVPENCPEVISELPNTRLSSIQEQPEMAVDILIKAFADKHFSKGTSEEDLPLSIHLREVQEAISCDVSKLLPPPKEACFLESPQECYCQRIFKHLQQILIYIRTTKQTFTLLEWVVQSCSSQELIGHPNFNDEALQKPAIILLSNFLSHAEEKALPIIQEEMSTSLTKILQNEAPTDIESYSGNEEEFVALYVDAIQCIDAVRKSALKISPTFKTSVEMVCFHELQKFVKMYISAAEKHNRKQTKTDKTILIHSFKTFNNCAELKQYVQTTGENINNNLHSEIISAFKNMETSALKLVLDTLNRQTEISFKCYFKKGGYMGEITADIKELLDPIPDHCKTQETLMNKAYESIVMLYLTCLVQSNPARVKKMWSDVGQRVCQDSQLLDDMFQSLNPNVERRNFDLLNNVGNILTCSSIDIDIIKLIAAKTVKECPTVSVDLIKALLRWKGITSRQIRDVIEVCQDHVSEYNRPRRWNYGWWNYCCCL